MINKKTIDYNDGKSYTNSRYSIYNDYAGTKNRYGGE